MESGTECATHYPGGLPETPDHSPAEKKENPDLSQITAIPQMVIREFEDWNGVSRLAYSPQMPMPDHRQEKPLHAWIDGAIVAADSPTLPLLDQSYLSGMGAFETIRVEGGVPLFLDAHHQRLQASAGCFQLPVPRVDTIRKGILQLLSGQGVQTARVRLTVSGSIGSDGTPFRFGGPVRTTILAFPLSYNVAAPARCITAPYRIDPDQPLAGHKCTSYALHAMAVHHARSRGGDEALMLNRHGEVAGGATGNIFWVADERVFTPDICCGCREGVTRERVIGACGELGIALETTRTMPASLSQADEIFTTSAIRGLRPVASLDGVDYPAGAVARRIRAVLMREEKRVIHG